VENFLYRLSGYQLYKEDDTMKLGTFNAGYQIWNFILNPLICLRDQLCRWADGQRDRQVVKYVVATCLLCFNLCSLYKECRNERLFLCFFFQVFRGSVGSRGKRSVLGPTALLILHEITAATSNVCTHFSFGLTTVKL
jgi:hypothetical protein